MNEQGDEGTDRFLRVLLELAVAHCLASEQPLQPLSPPPAGQPALPDSTPLPSGTFASESSCSTRIPDTNER